MIAVTLLALALAASAAVLPSQEQKRSLCPDGIHSTINPACCSWAQVRDNFITNIFDHKCGEDVHSLIRITFHDAIGFSTTNPALGGGADGSMITFQDQELTYHANTGIDFITGFLQPFADENKIGYADAIYFGIAVATSLCPGAPKLNAFVGRANATRAAPDHTVPEPFDDLNVIFARMADAGFTPAELVHMLAAHSVGDQASVDPSPLVLGSPFDSTPSDFDSQVFLEVMLRGTLFPGNGSHQGEVQSPLPGEFRLLTDHLFDRDSRTSCEWQAQALNQTLMAQNFAAGINKLALLGQNSANLLDCTEVIANAPPATQKQAFFPAGQTHSNIEQGCASQLFPTTLITKTGAFTPIPLVTVDPIILKRNVKRAERGGRRPSN